VVGEGGGVVHARWLGESMLELERGPGPRISPAQSPAAAHGLRAAASAQGLQIGLLISAGMSGDFELAIEEGATQVRLGSALFGARG
jgi:hypothetical protein